MVTEMSYESALQTSPEVQGKGGTRSWTATKNREMSQFANHGRIDLLKPSPDDEKERGG